VLSRDNEIKLRRTPADPNITIQMMFENRTLYTPPAIGNCIEDGYFVIHLSSFFPFYIFYHHEILTFVLVVRDYPLTAVTSFNGNLAKIHKCISRRVYGPFSGDRHAPNLAAEIDTSCDETERDSQAEDSDEDILSASLTDMVNVSVLSPIVI
jgi:hypothetical protein